MPRLLLSIILSIFCSMVPVHAQEALPKEDSDPQAQIIVRGKVLPTEKPVVGVKPEGRMAKGNRRLADHSDSFARCVKTPDLELMRRIIDGPPNSSNMRFALDAMIRRNRTCYGSFPVSQYSEPALGSCNPAAAEDMPEPGGIEPPKGSMFISDPRLEHALTGVKRCRSLFDYGALLIKAMDSYAPDLTLTVAQTQDEAVVKRFLAREKPRSRYRLDADLYYFAVTSCMVQRQPELAVRLFRAPMGDASEAVLRQALIDRTRDCTQNAKQVTVDPSEFRVYVADAIYRWLVAAKGTDSLLPPA